nr:aspartate/glutamate racemase family protein [Methylobacterium brachythecii]
MINPNTSENVTDLVTSHVRRIAAPSVDVVPVTARFGARYIASRAALAIAGHAALDCLAEHVEGCDAVYLACFGDPGLYALQEVSPVPVVGMVEASCRAAAETGRFGIVTGGALWEAMLREIVAVMGLADRFTGVRTIAPTGGEIARDPNLALAHLAEACGLCVSEDGAEVVILGGAALAGLAARIQPHLSVPVICSVEAGTRAVLAAPGAKITQVGARAAMESIGLGSDLAALLAGRTK